MKRLSVLVLALLMVFICCACKSTNDTSSTSSAVESTTQQDVESLISTEETLSSTEDTNTTNSTNSHTHNFADATCTKPATCSCGATIGAAYNHSYTNGVCERCNQKDPNYQTSSKFSEDTTASVPAGMDNDFSVESSYESSYEKCSVRGNDLPHRYSEHTCIEICDFCGEENSNSFGHTIDKSGVCSRCNQTFTPIDIEYPTPLVFDGVTMELVNFTYNTKSGNITFALNRISPTTGAIKEFFVKMTLYNGNTKIASKTITKSDYIFSATHYILSSYITDDTTKIVLENIS